MPFSAVFTAIIRHLGHGILTSKLRLTCSLIDFPTEILWMIDNYLPPIDGLSLRVTCRTLFIKLPCFKSSQLGPGGSNMVSSILHFWEICTLERQNCLLVDSEGTVTFRRAQRAKGRLRYRQYACAYCHDAHAGEYFSKNQLQQRPEARICVVAEIVLQRSLHKPR
jgi:hypothetical protein